MGLFDKFSRKKKQQKKEKSGGGFVGFVLLSDAQWDKEKLMEDLADEWGITDTEPDTSLKEENPESWVFSYGGCMVGVSLLEAPVPDREAEINAANNYMWKDAVNAAKAHKAQLLVAVMGTDVPAVEQGKLFTKVVASCCKQETVLGVYTSGTVFEPGFYREASGMMKDGGLPILNWIWFGIYQNEKGTSGYTYGMEAFGKDEMEVVNANAAPSEIRDFLLEIVVYVLDADVVLRDGETIGFSEEQKLPITRSKGVALDGMTLKIGYEE